MVNRKQVIALFFGAFFGCLFANPQTTIWQALMASSIFALFIMKVGELGDS